LPQKHEKNELTASQIEDLRLAATKMRGAERREFQAQICLKYCGGNARKAESLLGWGRKNIQLGLEEKRSGIICLGAQSAKGGAKKWEEKQVSAGIALRDLAEAHAQQDPSFKTSIAYTRLTASEARLQLKALGYSEREIPGASTMAVILNRMGYRLRKVVKAKPKKNS
jgi:hypothetical protein